MDVSATFFFLLSFSFSKTPKGVKPELNESAILIQSTQIAIDDVEKIVQVFTKIESGIMMEEIQISRFKPSAFSQCQS